MKAVYFLIITGILSLLKLGECKGKVGSIGIQENRWQFPVTEYGKDKSKWSEKIKQSPNIGEIDMSQKEWSRSTKAVDTVLEMLLTELRKQETKYEGLRMDSYIKQGSSRDGLKVVAADEFDTVLEFHLEGLENNIRQRNIHTQGDGLVPGVCYAVLDKISMDKLAERYPKLHSKEVFVQKDSEIFISSRKLHQTVFESMIDKAINHVMQTISSRKASDNELNFSIKRQMNPPAISITITLDEDPSQKYTEQDQHKDHVNQISVDVVPGILLRNDTETKYDGVPLNCPIHAVCKWAEAERIKSLDFADSNLIWDIKTTGYEKHLLDVARRDTRKKYILTALRIIKAYSTRVINKTSAKGQTPPQIVTVLKSYHLKQIAIYLLYYLCHEHPKYKLEGAQKATLYFVDLLRASLEAGRLPHFFYSNNDIEKMLPGYLGNKGDRRLRYDLFRGIKKEALNQAKLSLENELVPSLEFDKNEGDDKERTAVITEFKLLLGENGFF